MANFYGATGLIGGSSGDLDNIDGTNLASGDGGIVITSTAAYIYYLNASSGASESSPDVIAPDANAGNKRWILVDIVGEDSIVELLKLYDTNKSHNLSLKWNENDTGDRVLNILVGGGDRSLTLNESLTIGDGNDGTITFSGASKTLTVADSVTVGTQSIADNAIVTVDDADAADNDYAKFTANGLEGRSYTEVKQDLDLEIGTDVLAQQTIGIADDNLLEVDGTPADGEAAVFTANGINGLSEAEFKAAFNLEIGTDVLAQQTIGIANDNLVEMDDADAADDDYAKFTANGLEGRSYSEVMTDLAGQALNMQDALLTRPQLLDYSEDVNAIGDTGGGSDAIDLESGNVVTATVSTAEQTFTFTNPPGSGDAGSFTLILTNGGSQTVNWPASVDWAGGTAPSLTASGVDVLTFTTVDGGTTWYGFAAGLDMQ